MNISVSKATSGYRLLRAFGNSRARALTKVLRHGLFGRKLYLQPYRW